MSCDLVLTKNLVYTTLTKWQPGDKHWNLHKNVSLILLVISRRALAREGDYEMMPVCVGACIS